MTTQQEKKEQDWTQRFGNMVASLYGDNLTALTHNELCSSIIEIANKGNTPPNEARILLPLGLQQIFNEPPIIRVNLHLNNKPVCLFEIKQGDVVENFSTIINGINEICRPLDIPRNLKEGEGMHVLTVELIREDGKSFDFYKQFFPGEALNNLQDFYTQAFGIEASAIKTQIETPHKAEPVTEMPASKTSINTVEKVIRAHRFELIDEDGEVCAELHSMRGIMGRGRRTIFSMKGSDCKTIHMVADTDTGEMSFGILQGGEYYPVNLGVNLNSHDSSPTLEIGGSCKVGNAYMRLTVDDDLQSPAIRLYDRKDKLRAELSVSKDGSPTFLMREKKAKESKGESS